MLGKDALAAVGFFSPVITAVSIAYVVINGMQVVTGNLVGAGKTKDVNRLFIGSFFVLTVIFSVFSLVCIIFRQGLAGLLGADGEAYALLCDYIKGYAPGILTNVLVSMLMAIAPFNNRIKLSYCSLAVMTGVDVLGDVLLVGPLGLYGIGLASTFSNIAALLVLLPGFIKKDKLFHFQTKDGMSIKLVGKVAMRGLPSLMLTGGVIIRNYRFNYSLNQYVGAGGVAVAGVMSTVSSLVASVPSGSSSAFASLAGIYIGEEDRESLIDLTRTAMRLDVLLCAAATGVIMHLASPLSALFFPNDESVQMLAYRMFLLTFTFPVPNVIYNILLQAYWAQNRMLLVNILSFAETASMGLFALFTVQSSVRTPHGSPIRS